MSKTFEFEQTSIPGQLTINLKDNFSYIWVDSRSADFYRVIFYTLADVLAASCERNTTFNKAGLKVKDDKGNFIIGAILKYQKPEEDSEEDSGNTYLSFTFDENDMTDLDIETDNHSDIFFRCAAMNAESISAGRFRNTDIMYNMFSCAIDTLIQFLDTNASETEEVDVVLRGTFTASVAVEGGKKIMSIVPGEVVKQRVKRDRIL